MSWAVEASAGYGAPEDVVRALELLGIRALVLGIHDPAFPSSPEEDVGRGTPYGAGGRSFLELARRLGFTGIQLGPQGLTSPVNPSPYDSTLFSRDPLSVALGLLATEGWGRLVAPATLQRWVNARGGPADRVAHAHARAAMEAVLDEAWRSVRRGAPLPGPGLATFRRRHAHWLERDALYAALRTARGGREWPEWTDARRRPHRDRALWATPRGRRRRKRLAARRHRSVEEYVFRQYLVHEQHQHLRDTARSLGLRLYADLQIGASAFETWVGGEVFLSGYRLGAPSSRTNPEGQPWGYPLLDPRRYRSSRGGDGPALRFLLARVDKLLDECDGLRLDHPHGLVCPWVYDSGADDPWTAVRAGARLFESPDASDHPRLAEMAIARPDQLDRSQPRHSDRWVRDLEPAQVERYALLVDAVIDAVRRRGGTTEDVVCEVLSTQPLPLAKVMERAGLGRFRVLQKVGLDDPADVYRSENAAPADWVMVGNHDTPTIWQVAEDWIASGRGRKHAEYLAGRLLPPGDSPELWIHRVAAGAPALAQAKLAELFVGPARHVMLFFTDVFGYRTPYNRPGTIHPDNWSLRLPVDFAEVYAERRAAGRALDLPLALATALRAQPTPERVQLAARLDSLAARNA